MSNSSNEQVANTPTSDDDNIMALYFDADGSLYNNDYFLKMEIDEKLEQWNKKPKKYPAIVRANIPLLEHCITIAKQKNCKIIDVSSFSARVSYLLDSVNSDRNDTGYFLADLGMIVQYLRDRCKTELPNCKVVFNRFLLDDIFDGYPYGTAYDRFTTDQFIADANKEEDKPEQLSANILLDHSKIFQSFVLMNVTRQRYPRGKVFGYFSDDKDKEILQPCHNFYANYSAAIPSKMSVEFIHHDSPASFHSLGELTQLTSCDDSHSSDLVQRCQFLLENLLAQQAKHDEIYAIPKEYGRGVMLDLSLLTQDAIFNLFTKPVAELTKHEIKSLLFNDYANIQSSSFELMLQRGFNSTAEVVDNLNNGDHYDKLFPKEELSPTGEQTAEKNNKIVLTEISNSANAI